MTELLEKAFHRAAKLPPEAQDTLAKRALAELNADDEWERLFADSGDELDALAAEALSAAAQKPHHLI